MAMHHCSNPSYSSAHASRYLLPFWLTIITLASLFGTGCVTVSQEIELVHYTIASKSDLAKHLPKKLVIMPIDVQVGELSMAGVEEVPEWTEQAKTLFAEELEAYADERDDLKLVDMPKLSRKQQATLEEHLALNRVVWPTAVSYATQMGPAWSHKQDRFDYSIGSGLKFMRKKTRADAGLILVGTDTNSSTGRVAANVLLSVLYGLPQLNGGNSFLAVGIVDFRTGNLLWVNWGARNTGSFLDPKSVRTMLDLVMSNYPPSKPTQ